MDDNIKKMILSLPNKEVAKANKYLENKEIELLYELIQDTILKVTKSKIKYGNTSRYANINLIELHDLSCAISDLYNEMLEYKDYLECAEKTEFERDYFEYE